MGKKEILETNVAIVNVYEEELLKELDTDYKTLQMLKRIIRRMSAGKPESVQNRIAQYVASIVYEKKTTPFNGGHNA